MGSPRHEIPNQPHQRSEPETPTQLMMDFETLLGNTVKPVLGLILVALVGGSILFLATPHGPGVNDDAVIYLGAARNLSEGDGLSRLAGDGTPEPVTHYPPGYPLVILIPLASGASLEVAARAVALILFMFSIVLTGTLTWEITRSVTFALIPAALLALSPIALEVYSWAISEPLFVALTLLALWLLRRYLKDRRTFLLYGAGLSVGLAWFSRYIGFTLFLSATVFLTWIWLRDRLRLRDLVGFILTSATPTALWLVRNLILTGTTTNRQWAWHPPGLDSLGSGLVAASEWVHAAEGTSLWIAVPAVPALLAPYIIYLIAVWPGDKASGEELTKRIGDGLPLLFSVIYLGGLIASMTFFDASTPMDRRLLFPIYPLWLVVCARAFQWAWDRTRGAAWLRAGAALVLVAATARYALETAQTTARLRADGRGFASSVWQAGDALDYLSDLSTEVSIYTNEPHAVNYLVGRGAHMVPIRVDTVVGRDRDDYEQSLRKMRTKLEAGDAVLVLLNSIRFHTHLAPEEVMTRGLEVVAQSPRMRVFRAPQGR